MKKLIMLIVLLNLFGVTAANAVSPEAILSLKAANGSGYYKVTVLQKGEGESLRTIFVLGERHKKVKAEKAIGTDVVSHFISIAVEGIKTDVTPDYINKVAIVSSLLMGGFYREGEERVLPLIGPYSKADMVYGTTAEDALKHIFGDARGRLNYIVDAYKGDPLGLTGLKGSLLSLNVNLLTGKIWTDKFSVPIGDIRDREVAGLLNSVGLEDTFIISNETLPFLVRRIEKRVNKVPNLIRLEDRHPNQEFRNYEKSIVNAGFAIKVCAGLVGLSAANLAAGDYTSTLVDSAIYGATLVGIALTHNYLHQRLNSFLPACMAMEIKPNTTRPLLDTRNPDMAKRIDEAFQCNDKLKDLLVVVGAGHNQGISDILTVSPFGWKTVNLDEVVAD